MDRHNIQKGFIFRIHWLVSLLFIAAILTEAPSVFAILYKTSEAAKTDMASYEQRQETAKRCAASAVQEQSRLVAEKQRHEQKAWELAQQIVALEAEAKLALEELAQGYYCSRCNRSASEIERETHTPFQEHLRRVNGHPIPAAPGVIDSKRKEYEQKIKRVRTDQGDALARATGMNAQIEQAHVKRLKCNDNFQTAREGFVRAKHWFAVLQRLEMEGRLNEQMMPKPLAADQFGLGSNTRTSEFFVQRAYLKNGRVVTLEPGVHVNPADIERIATHRGIDFSSREDGSIKPLPFTAGVKGKAWVVPGSKYNTINVSDEKTKNVFQFLHASDVSPTLRHCTQTQSCRVGPKTQLGTTGSTGAGATHLHVQVKDNHSRYIDPDMALLPGDSPFVNIEREVQRELHSF